VALSVTVMEALRVPAAVAENVTLILQAVPAARLPLPTGQVSAEMVKSPELVPPSTTLENVTGLLPVFVIWTLCGLLVVPVFCAPKVRLTGLKLRVKVPIWPVPLSVIVCGLPVALSVTVMDAERAPAAVGEKVTLMAQFAPAARLPDP